MVVLLVLPLVGCSPKDDPVVESNAIDEEITEARLLIDDIVDTFVVTSPAGRTDEELDHEQELIEEVEESLARWESDFDERIALARWSGAMSRLLAVQEQYVNLHTEFEVAMFSDSMNHSSRGSLLAAFQSYIEEHESELHQEILGLRGAWTELEGANYYRQRAQNETRASKISLQVLESHRADLIGEEDGLFTTREFEYLDQHFEVSPEVSTNWVLLLEELINLQEAQTAWKQGSQL